MLEKFKDIPLDKSSRTPLYMQLYTHLKDFVTGGILLPDTRLPSIRQLSAQLGVNQVTVVSAYKELENTGFAYSRAGSGTFVANFLSSPPADVNNTILDELYQNDDFPLVSNDQIRVNEQTVNFASTSPTPDLFPVEDFKVALNDVLERDKGNVFGYQDSQGFHPLRECIAGILQQKSIGCTTESIQIISGAQQGIDVISKAFLNQGDYVVTESPTYTGAIAVFRSRGAQIADVPLEKDGLNLNILEYNLKKYKPKLIYTIPSFQNPTGYSYSNNKRTQVVKLAEKYNAYIIEDDYVSDLDFEGKGFLPLKALDHNNRVIYIKSFSKIFMPGLRLGFMIVPNNLRQNILDAKHTTDISTSGLIQRAFDLYIRKGFWDKHLNFMYGIYKDRYVSITKALDASLPGGITYLKPGGGLNLWLDLPYGFQINSLLKAAASNHIVFAPGRIFYSGSQPQNINNLRLSFAAVYNDQIEKGIETLCSIMGNMLEGRNRYTNIRIL